VSASHASALPSTSGVASTVALLSSVQPRVVAHSTDLTRCSASSQTAANQSLSL
jgi:hypothetical protein